MSFGVVQKQMAGSTNTAPGCFPFAFPYDIGTQIFVDYLVKLPLFNSFHKHIHVPALS